MRQKMKYCDQAKAVIRTLKRGDSKGWVSSAAGAAALHKHLANCMKCGRDLEGVQWPPP
jgi:hypothetical protein